MKTNDIILLGAGFAAGRLSKKMQAGPIGAISSEDKNKIYDLLQKGDKVKIEYGNAISAKNEATLIVTRGKTKLLKGRVERITFVNIKNPKGVKYYLYNRNGFITFATGDMSATINSITII
jgi:hypothetical protein